MSGFTAPDVARHGGSEVPQSAVPPPQLGSSFELDRAVIEALPIPGSEVISARNYGMSLWGQTAKITAELPTGQHMHYFLKTISLGDSGRLMMEGEFESLKAIHSVSPEFAPCPYAWGKFENLAPNGTTTHFLLTEFRDVGKQPPDPIKFTARLAEIHRKSVSPTGKFGFHITTCHAKLPQVTDCWEDLWAVLYKKQLEHMINMDEEKHGEWPEFKVVCNLVLKRVIPRLLDPLQSDGRTIKPCLVHGDLWDENTATDMGTGEPFVFDAGSFYAHNEYEIGNWRAARHRLSDGVYVRNYQHNFPISEPKDEWDDRNLLYSLRYDLGAAILITGCNLRQVVKENMTLLCQKLCPAELRAAQGCRVPSLSDHPDDHEIEEEEDEE